MEDAKMQSILDEYRNSIDPGKQTQKAEALSQQKDFLGGLETLAEQFGSGFFKVKNLPEHKREKVYKHNPILKYEPPPSYSKEALRLLGYKPDKIKDRMAEEIKRKSLLINAYCLEWAAFCNKWSVKSSWDGKLKSLTQSLCDSVRIGVIERPTIGKKEIFISLDAWGTQGEVLAKWDKIKEMQNSILSGKVEADAKYKRDSCWRRLYEELNFGCSQIASIWKEYFLNEIEVFILRKLKDDVAKIFREKSKKKLDLKTKSDFEMSETEEAQSQIKKILDSQMDEALAIEEIKSEKRSKDLKELFERKLNEYVSSVGRGEKVAAIKTKKTNKTKITKKATKATKATPQFENTISTALRRMRSKPKKLVASFPQKRSPFKLTYVD